MIARPLALLVAIAALAGAVACAPGAWPASRATGLALAPGACGVTVADADDDGLDDGCELALARAFAPALVADRRDCLWSADAGGGRLAGGWLFAAQPIAGGGARIAYMPAYLRDCGWSGAPCLLRERRCGAHAGDSELVLVDVSPASGARVFGARVAGALWTTTGVFLSAHCFGRSDGRCRWYRGSALARFAWVDGVRGGAPVVWVARGKHGGYPTREDCEAGHWAFDSCDGNAATFCFPVRSAAQNAGSRARPAGCVAGTALEPVRADVDPMARECPWDAARPFRGWQRSPDGPPGSSYARYLARFAGL